MSWLRFIRTNRASLGYMTVVGVLPLVVSSAVTLAAIRFEETILLFGATEWLLFFMTASLTMAFGLTPTTFIALLSGYFLGWSSVAGVLTSYLAASLFGYAAASAIDRGRFVRSIQDVMGSAALIERLRAGEIPFIILARISPFLPFAIMNVLLAAIRVDLKRFLAAGFIGMLPRTLLFIWIGMQFGAIVTLLERGGEHAVARVGLIVLLIVSIVGLYAFFRRYLAGVLEGPIEEET